jgi:very-short-patch-repair endonuclease
MIRAAGQEQRAAGNGRTGNSRTGAGHTGNGRTGSGRSDEPRPAPEVIITEIAAVQHGIVDRGQLLAAGVSRHLVDNGVKTGKLRPVHHGVYQVEALTGPRAREVAALLACGGGVIGPGVAWLSHRTGAALCGWVRPQATSEPADVSVPHGRRGARRAGIRVHQAEPDAAPHMVDGLPVTSPAYLLIELSGVASRRELERAFAMAQRAGLVERDELVRRLDRNPRRPGARRLRALVTRAVPPAFTRSALEERLLELIRSGGLPEPETNVVIHGYEVDFLWRTHRLVVEVDGYAYHSSTRAVQRDRQRDIDLAAEGIQVLRLVWRQIVHRRDRTLVQLTRALVHTRP